MKPDAQAHERMTGRRLARRLLLMLGTFVGYSVAELLAKGLVLLQVVVVAFRRTPAPRLVGYGETLSRYIYEAWRYLTFCSYSPPWPMSRWQ